MRVAVDFALPARSSEVPRHGWARDSQDLKILWLSVFRLLHNAQDLRKCHGIDEQLTHGQWAEIQAFRHYQNENGPWEVSVHLGNGHGGRYRQSMDDGLRSSPPLGCPSAMGRAIW